MSSAEPVGLGLSQSTTDQGQLNSSEGRDPGTARGSAAARKRQHRYRRAEYQGTIVERDYSDGTMVRFVADYPDELAGHQLSRDEFERTVGTINRIFWEAESWGVGTFLESVLACASLYTLWLCWTPYHEKQMIELRRFVAHENQTVYHPKGLHIMDPLLNGLLHLQIVVIPAGV